MEHIVQFGINIDDEVIKKTIVSQAQGQIVGVLKQDAMKELTGNQSPTSWEYRGKVKDIIVETTNEFLEANKDRVINEAAILLSEKLARTKAVKEAMGKLASEIGL